jgi:hypothetical protein
MDESALPPETGSGSRPGRPAPIEPGGGSYHEPDPPGPRELEESRADLVLLLGILSLFLCFPLGIAAWVMGNSDLKKIRSGRMRRRKEGTLRLGRNLGAFGTVVFVLCTALALYALPGRIRGALSFASAGPLPANRLVFAGRWVGDKGTIIRIRRNGRADFRTRGSSVKGGVVRIGKDSLSIGLLGIFKTWRIEKRPYKRDGIWMMKLNGEVFKRESDDSLLVRREGVRGIPHLRLPGRARLNPVVTIG